MECTLPVIPSGVVGKSDDPFLASVIDKRRGSVVRMRGFCALTHSPTHPLLRCQWPQMGKGSWMGGRDAETNKTEDAQPFNLGMTDEVVQFPLG